MIEVNSLKKEKEKNEFRTFRKVFVCIVSVLMIAGMVIGFILPLRPTVSEFEKRKLTEFPNITWTSFWDGTFESELSKWFSDTFPFRENMLIAEQGIKSFYGLRTDAVQHVAQGDDIPEIPSVDDESTTSAQSESESTTTPASSEATAAPETPAPISGDEVAKMNPQECGSVNILDLVGYCVYGFNAKAGEQYCQDVASLANAVSGKAQVYEMMIPNNSAIMLPDETKAAWGLSDETKVINFYEGRTKQLNGSVKTISIFDTLRSHRDQPLYYKTDHHWSQVGAYYAYRKYCEVLGFKPHELSEYPMIDNGTFLGSYYSASGFSQLAGNPDHVISYTPITCNTITFFDSYQNKMRSGPVVRDLSALEPNTKYMSYIYGDNSYSEIINPNVKNGKKCAVIKESFGNCFVPFLVDHYEEVYVIDYRSYKEPVSKLVTEKGIQDILFINNLEAISDKPTMDVLGNICH